MAGLRLSKPYTTHNKLARVKIDHVVNDWPEACWLCVKYNLVIDGRVASGCTMPVITISGSKTLSQRRYAGEPVFRKYIPSASFNFAGAANRVSDVVTNFRIALHKAARF